MIVMKKNKVTYPSPVSDDRSDAIMLARIREAQDRHQCGRATPMDEAFLAGSEVRRYFGKRASAL